MDSELWLKIFEGKGTIVSYGLLILLLSCIMFTKIETSRENMRIKIAILYILSYVLVLFNAVDIKAMFLVLLIMLFVFLEFVLIDNFKRKFMKLKKKFLVLDYIYQIIFEYKILYFLLALFSVSSILKSIIMFVLIKLNLISVWLKNCYPSITTIISLLILGNGIIKMLNNEFETIEFEKINEKIKNVKEFNGFSANPKLKDFSELLTYKEDKSFFERNESYNWFSVQFIKYRLRRMYISCKKHHIKEKGWITKAINKLITFFYYEMKFAHIIVYYAKRLLKAVYNKFKNKKKLSDYLPGHSTIEMQLLRTLAVVDGYDSHVYQRKFYEIIYSYIFFNSLKEYYEDNLYENMHEFKYYIIYIYIMVAPIKINGVFYDNIRELYKKQKLNSITMEEFYIWELGLSHVPIKPWLLESIYIDIFGIDRKKLSALIQKFNKKKNNKL